MSFLLYIKVSFTSHTVEDKNKKETDEDLCV